MEAKRLVQVSKFLSKHLRHDPKGLGLELAPGGWVHVEDLLAGCAKKGMPLTVLSRKGWPGKTNSITQGA